MIRRSPLLDFMERHYTLLPPAPKTGPFLIENSPYLAEIMHALCDPGIREVTSQVAAQGGKNLVAEGFISYIPTFSPGNILFYGQTDEDAKTFAETRALKRAKDIPYLKSVWPDSRPANRKDEALLEHMLIEFLGASPSNARGKSAPFVICDEKHLKLWQGMGKIIKKRAAAFWDHKILNISTAGETGSEIDLDFKRGTQEDWYLGCPECKRLVRPKWSEKPRIITWEGTEEEWALMYPEKKRWNFQEVKKRVRFKCPYEDCNCEERDSEPVRKEMNRLGGYVSHHSDFLGWRFDVSEYLDSITDSPRRDVRDILAAVELVDHRSFHASQICFQWVPWEQITEEWIQACEQQKTGDLSNLKTFIIETMGETWDNRVSAGSRAHVSGGYSLNDKSEWEKEHRRFMTIDVQSKDGQHFWYVIRAWAEDGSSRLYTAGRADTWGQLQEIQNQYKVLDKCTGVDARHKTKVVKEACAAHGWTWLMADEGEDREYIHTDPATGAKIKRPFKPPEWSDVFPGTAKQGRKYAKGFHFSKDWARKSLHNRLIGIGSPWELPHDIAQLQFEGTSKAKSSYLAQLESWTRATIKDPKTNQEHEGWKQIYADDHLRACEEMSLIMGAMSGIVPSEL